MGSNPLDAATRTTGGLIMEWYYIVSIFAIIFIAYMVFRKEDTDDEYQDEDNWGAR